MELEDIEMAAIPFRMIAVRVYDTEHTAHIEKEYDVRNEREASAYAERLALHLDKYVEVIEQEFDQTDPTWYREELITSWNS